MIEWFTPWRFVKPADYEEWFEKLAAKGRHPKISRLSAFCMKFVKGESKRYKYVVDLQAFPKEEYFDTYASFGWEYVGKMSSMFIWRKEYLDEKPESFSDAESLAKRNGRFVKAMSFSLAMCLIGSALLWTGFGVTLAENGVSDAAALGVVGALTLAISFLLAAVMIKIKKNRK